MKGIEGGNVIKMDSYREGISFREYKKRLEEKFGPETEIDKENHRFERRVFGECVIQGAELIDPKAPLQEMVEFAKAHQPAEKALPLMWIEKGVNKYLQRLGCKLEVPAEGFSAVNTPMDFEKGSDGFLQARNQTITIDYTAGTEQGKERKGYKADLVLAVDLNASKDEILDSLDGFAEKAAHYIKGRLDTIDKYQAGTLDISPEPTQYTMRNFG